MPTITVAVGRWKFQLRLNLGSTRLPPMADETGRRHHEKYNRHLFLKIQTHSGEQIQTIIHLKCLHRFSSTPFHGKRCSVVGIFQRIHEKHERQIFSYIQTQNKNINTQSRCSKMLKVMRTSWQKKPQTFHSNFKAAQCRRQTPHPPIPLITLQCATTACLGPKFSFCLFVFVLSCS